MASESKKAKSSTTFRALMKVHIQQTWAYVEALCTDEEAKKEAFQGLTTNIADWAVHISPKPAVQSRWMELHTQHTLYAAAYAEGVLQCPCSGTTFMGHCDNAAKARQAVTDLGNNQKLIVHFLVGLLGEERRVALNTHWSNHLECTVQYIGALHTFGRDSSRYRKAKKHCLELGEAFGMDLDAWTR